MEKVLFNAQALKFVKPVGTRAKASKLVPAKDGGGKDNQKKKKKQDLNLQFRSQFSKIHMPMVRWSIRSEAAACSFKRRRTG